MNNTTTILYASQATLTYNISMLSNEILGVYNKSQKHLFFLDYDGTLAEIVSMPSEAAPTPNLLKILEDLGGNPSNTVVVISGRTHQELEEWLGRLPVILIAEHGLAIKRPGGHWEITKEIDASWKPEVHAIMQPYCKDLAGTFIEEKMNGLVWHYRLAQPVEAAAAEKRLVHELEKVCQALHLKLMRGNKIIEILPLGYDKGTGARYVLQAGEWDFICAAGDDTTDEDLFRALPPLAFTIKIGGGESIARHHLGSPRALRALLALLS